MKSFFLLFIVFSLSVACSNSGDNFIVAEEIVPITTVTAPETLTVGMTATFNVVFNIPSTCHSFLRLNFGSTVDERIVSVVTSVREGNCNPLSNASQNISFEVTPDAPGMFTFKFFTGNDSQGSPTFIVKEYEVAPRPIG